MTRRTAAGSSAAVALAVGCLLVSCGGSSSGVTSVSPSAVETTVAPADSAAPTTSAVPATLHVRLDDIRASVAAVERELGGKQAYSEVNATQTEVNVFVVSAGKDNAYVVKDGVVSSPSELGAYTGRTFAASDVAFAPNVLDKVLATIRDSEVVAFSVTPNEKSGVDYIATVTAPNGEFRVLLSPDGSIIATS